MRLDTRTIALLTVPPLCWAGNAVVGRAVVGEFPPLALSLLRWLLALAILVPLAWPALRAERAAMAAVVRQQPWLVVALSVLGVGVYNSFQYLALQTAPALNVTLIASSAPVFILLVGAIAFGERVRGAQVSGAMLSIAGVVVVLVRGDWQHLLGLQLVAGDLWMLAAAASWAVYTWLLRRHRPDLGLAPLLALQMAVGAASIAPFAAWEAAQGAAVAWSLKTAGALLFVALLPSLAAYWCWDRGVARAGAVLPVYFANLTPIFAAVFGAVALGEAPRAYHAVGLVFIVAGIHLAARR